jgi:hypothetical protein
LPWLPKQLRRRGQQLLQSDRAPLQISSPPHAPSLRRFVALHQCCSCYRHAIYLQHILCHCCSTCACLISIDCVAFLAFSA